TGKQTEAEVDRHIEAGQYKTALDAIPSPFWRSWRSNPAELHERVVRSADGAAKDLAEKGDVEEALRIQTQLKGDLTRDEETQFRDHVFEKAIQSATALIAADEYKKAHNIYALLDKAETKNVDVARLGEGL